MAADDAIEPRHDTIIATSLYTAIHAAIDAIYAFSMLFSSAARLLLRHTFSPLSIWSALGPY